MTFYVKSLLNELRTNKAKGEKFQTLSSGINFVANCDSIH